LTNCRRRYINERSGKAEPDQAGRQEMERKGTDQLADDSVAEDLQARNLGDALGSISQDPSSDRAQIR